MFWRCRLVLLYANRNFIAWFILFIIYGGIFASAAVHGLSCGDMVAI